MSSMLGNLQPAVKEETKKIAIYSGILVIVMWIGFWAFHLISPDTIPFDYTVFLGGIGGWIISVVNFFVMGIAVQKIANTEEDDAARSIMKISYTRRILMQMLWVIIAIAAPCFQFVSGILPLLFPSLAIKARGIFQSMKK